MLAINEVLQKGRYLITNHFAEDMIGTGYEAFDNVLETNVLLKQMPVNLKITNYGVSEEALQSESAAKILAEIKHPSLLRVRDCFSEVNNQFLVFEAVNGNSLSELLAGNKKPFSLSEVANWADQLLDALHYLHSHGAPIIHRDLKPQNIKLTAGGKIKLFALGIAKNTDAKLHPTITNKIFDHAALHFSPLEQIWGGLDRASQNVIANSYDEKSEKILNQPPDARTDVYALGATLYNLLTARLPIDALERSIDILEGKSDPLPLPCLINPNVPPEISDVLMKALEIKRENRFDSALTMRQTLRAALFRVKERSAPATKKQEDILEIPISDYKTIQPERRSSELKRLEVEAEQKRQTELIKQQLRESEAQRLKAEQRAAEAEKRLSEKETNDAAKKEPLTTNINSTKGFQKIPLKKTDTVKSDKKSGAPVNSTEEFKDLFVQPQKDTKHRRRIFVFAAVLIIFGGAFCGFQFLPQSKMAEFKQIVSAEPLALENKPVAEPIVEIPAVPVIEPTQEINSEQTAAEPPPVIESPKIKETPAVRSMSREKPNLLQTTVPKIEKRIPAAPKVQPKPQKIITVDDLINDN